MLYDLESIKEKTDLTAVIEADLGPGRKQGQWIMWQCPFHNDHTPSFAVGPENRIFKCFACGETGDILSWGTKYRNLGFTEWCGQLAGDPMQTSVQPHKSHRRPQSKPVNDDWPAEEWQTGLTRIVLDCHKNLYKSIGQKARQYLLSRSLTDETLQRFWVGFNPVSSKMYGHWVYAGIIIPHQSHQLNTIFGLKIRLSRQGQQDWLAVWQRHNPDKDPAGVKIPKYVAVKGGKPNLYNVDSLEYGVDQGFFYVGAGTYKENIFIAEGEFDTMLLEQEAGDLIAPLTLGGATTRLSPRWLVALKYAKRFYICQNTDPAGQNGTEYWQKLTGQKSSVAVLPPKTGDITDLVKAGYNLRNWVQNELKY
jgi:DNA primase